MILQTSNKKKIKIKASSLSQIGRTHSWWVPLAVRGEKLPPKGRNSVYCLLFERDSELELEYMYLHVVQYIATLLKEC